MKKTISIVLLLALCLSLFAGCDLIPLPQQPPVEASNLERAKSLVFNAYKPAKKGDVPAKSTDFEVMATVLVDGETFPVAWTVEVTSGPADAVKIVDGSSDAFKLVDLTEKPAVDVTFTLTATISDSEGNTETVSFNFKTPKFEAPTAGKVVIKNVADAKYATGTEYKYTSSSGSVKMELALTENKANALAYTMIENADSTVSFKTDDGYFLSCDATNVEFVTAESDYTKFVLEVADGGYYIKCAVANYSGKAQYLEVYSGYLTCYGMGSNTDLYIFALEDATGANGKVQKEGTSTTPTEPTTPPATEPTTPSIPEGVVDPVAGTAYKFGMVQTNKGGTYYLKGGMSGYYMATTTDITAAIDVYLEATEGGFYFYTLENGTKTYINMVAVIGDDGKNHVNGKFESTASTVYTYDATSKTLIADIDGVNYWFGTRNDKSYDTVGPCDASKGTFICQFYGEGTVTPPATEPTEPTTPSEPTTPPATEPSGSTPQEIVDAAYALEESATMPNVTLTGKITSIQEPYSSQYKNITVVIVIEGRESKPIVCFRMKGEGAETLAKNDTITVTGTIKNYYGTIEFDAGCTFTDLIKGEPDPVDPDQGNSVTISFDDKANRTTFSSSQQVWQQNGITVTNDQAASTSAVADYAKPARFYASSALKIEFAGMKKIVFELNSGKPASGLVNAVTVGGNVASCTANGYTVTIEFTEAVDSFEVAKLAAQIRVDSITVYN